MTTNQIVLADRQPSLKWGTLSLIMRTVGRASRGIDAGYRYGFDSGEMLDYVYENRARGRLLLGRIVDRLYLNAVGWRGIRNRRELLKGLVREAIERDRRAGQPTRILDVASGPGRYLLEVLEEAGDREVSAVCRDLDETGLRQGRELAGQRGLANVRHERGDAFDPASLATVDPPPNVVIVSGLYELFLDHERILTSLRAINGILRAGGTILVTTQVKHPQLDMIANVLPNREGLPWIMECRPTGLTERWLREAGFVVVASHTEPLGLFAVTVARKTDD